MLEVARAAGPQRGLDLQCRGAKDLVAMAQGGLAGMIDFVGAPCTSALAVPGLRKG
jgi:hypothetical protein